MSANDLHSFRMVIQQISVEPAYRVVAYGDWEKPRHADFGNKEALLRALHTALPHFDTSCLSFDPLHRGQGSIVFAGEIQLSHRQLGLLELT